MIIDISKASLSPSQAEKLVRESCNDFLLSPSQAEKLVRESCNDFLKTKQGFHYLLMKYPHLSVPQAINEYIKTALWIDHVV